ncbi:elongation factor EF-2 [Sulfodiicoccus acidiphilus]|uniref:Elongation factor 2 n=1 Tax=Sulfodiicoccus acidiphilus TaxID=1670455 RepID=A0A348B134_9CREN|nr:elongation factor EF-2 [Sulfodiicoccus acidiphilus]BBD71886.1 elongation factor EF-2 [Sulfodiicoccus acidiphilus]GGT91213.1 elongation factor EF-2 [Sulfodiicoccus acidiphilus]
MPRYKTVEQILALMKDRTRVRNIGIIAHVDHGKTTTSDQLLASAGIISPKVAGEALALDYLKVEQQRGITVKAANVSLYHEVDNKGYVINLIDTPGHVDFSGRVTRSLRVLDGSIVVVDSVEGVMTQTETVLRQSLEERVRPILFINKVDRLVKELKLGPQEMMQKLLGIIREVNNMIDMYAEPDFKERWKINPNAGNVVFGSAKDKWGFSVPMSQKKGIGMKDVIAAYTAPDKTKLNELAQQVPIDEALLDAVIRFVPDPVEAQKYRIPKIWKGDLDNELAKAMLSADMNGPVVMMITDMKVDPHAGLVATGRVFSGTVRPGQEVWLVNAKTPQRTLQVSLYMGQTRELAEEIPAGNIAAVLGLDKARSGETLLDVRFKDLQGSFERLHYVSEPVVTIAVDPQNPKDLAKMIDALRKLSIEDPNLVVKINEETGEYLLSGMGFLHLEVSLQLLKDNYGIEVKTTPPIVVYRESVRNKSQVFEGKSPNKHNKMYISVEPLNDKTVELIASGTIKENMEPKEMAKTLRDQAGWDYEEGKRIVAFDENLNLFVDMTSGIQHLREVMDTLIQGFRLAMREGPLAHEPVRGLKVVLHDAVIHEDPAHRGPAQLYPAVRNAIFAGFLSARPTLLEPIQKLDIRIPMEFMGNVTAVLSRKRGKILNVVQTENLARIMAEIPISESFELAGELRGATAGRAFWGTEFSRWAPVPDAMLGDTVVKIRERKGLPKELPKVEDFLS